MKVFKIGSDIKEVTLAPEIKQFKDGSGVGYSFDSTYIPLTGKLIKGFTPDKTDAIIRELAKGKAELGKSVRDKPIIRLTEGRGNQAILAYVKTGEFFTETPEYLVSNAEVVSWVAIFNGLFKNYVSYPIIFSKSRNFKVTVKLKDESYLLYKYELGVWSTEHRQVTEIDFSEFKKI